MGKSWFLAAALGAVAAVATALPAWSQAVSETVSPAEDWAAMARQDIDAAYGIYVANHPGMHDPANRDFPARLERARESGLAAARRVADRAGYVEALGIFSAELNDGHALIFAKPPPSGTPLQREWPGFIAAWRGEGMLIHHAGSGSPAPAGASILACDDRPIREFVLNRMRTRGLRPAEAGLWWFRGPQAFTSSPTLAAGRPERCRFRLPDGLEHQSALTWTAAPENLDGLLAAASDGELTPIGLSEARPGLFLVGLPDFNPDQNEVQAYRALYDSLRQRRPDLLRARAVILDLRHNNGGSSYWSRETANILWGEPLVSRAMAGYFRNVSIWWRASEDNVAYMAEMERQIRGNGNAESADSTRRTGESMRAALGRGEPFYVQQLDEEEAGPAPAGSDFSTPVYVIVPGRCASACLDALDVFTRFPNTRLIGAPSSGDSTYMEVRATDLPSGRGRIVIPNKIWVGRPRGSGEVYRPAIPMNALHWSTAVFLDAVERDVEQTGN